MRTDAEFSAVLTGEMGFLIRLARSITRDDIDLADDLVQRTMLGAWRARRRLRNDDLRAWLTVIMRNQFRSYLKVKARHPEVADVDGGLTERMATPDRAAAEVDMARLLERLEHALPKLTPEMRTALLGYCVDHQTYRQLARRMRCEVGTVRSRLARARAELCRLVGPESLELAEPDLVPEFLSDSDSGAR